MDTKSQYKLLEQLQSTIEYSYRNALDPVNINKNRVETILAPDNNRPYLMTQVDKTTDYINAVFVNSYRQTPSYIVTQYPLPHTCIDFWRLVYDHNVSIIMLLESIVRDSKTVYYWSSVIGQVVPYGPFEIVMVSQKEDEQLIERVFELKCINKSVFTADRTRTIRQFQVKDYSYLLSIIKRFLKEMRTYSEQNVILQCLNGATWSGYFAALCNSIDKMQTEQIIDPFKVVRLLRAVRPQFIDQDQYENLFLSMREYAQQHLVPFSSHRTNENPFYMNTSTQDSSFTPNRIIQRL
jgi:protein tyrosine phosphatase